VADLYPAVEVGEAVKVDAQLSFKAQTAITKGQLVKMDTHTDGEIGSVSPAGAGDKAIGVALKSVNAGEYVPVLIRGIVKVTASGAISIGSLVKAGANGVVVAANTYLAYVKGTATTYVPDDSTIAGVSLAASGNIPVDGGLACGIALQTFADGDTGLIYVGV